MAEPRPWHHLFALSLVDFFAGTAVTVEAEKDLSHRHQLLDLVILRPGGAALPRPMPDGLEELAGHNLVTFKSHREALDGWALDELVGHYVNYRKQVSPDMGDLLPESDFRRFAVCVRSPRGLAGTVELRRLRHGVYEAPHFSGVIRVIVVHELPREEQNAMLMLFSAREELVEYAARHYRPHSPQTSTLLDELVAHYRREGLPMPETLAEMRQRHRREIIQELTPEERLQGVPVGKLLEAIPAEERVQGLSLEDRVKGISLEELEALARRLREGAGPASAP